MFYDVHCHLMDKVFDADRFKIVRECAEKNISIFEAGYDYNTNIKVLELAKGFDNVHCCIGLHPTAEFDERVFKQVKDNKSKIIGIGEVGLDYKYGKKKQEEVFKRFILMAEEFKKPLIVHSRSAHKRVLELIKEVKVPVVLHCFNAGKKLIEEALGLNQVFLSIPAIVEYDEQYQSIVKKAPIQRLLCETDSPYLWKLGRNSPLNVLKSYETIARFKKVSLARAEAVIQASVKKTLLLNEKNLKTLD